MVQECEYEDYQIKPLSSNTFIPSIYTLENDICKSVIKYVYNIDTTLYNIEFSNTNYFTHICNIFKLRKVDTGEQIVCGLCSVNYNNEPYFWIADLTEDLTLKGIHAYKIIDEISFNIKFDENVTPHSLYFGIKNYFYHYNLALLGHEFLNDRFVLPPKSTFLEGKHIDCIKNKFYGIFDVEDEWTEGIILVSPKS